MVSRPNQIVTTAAQLLQMPVDENRYELVNGVLKMMSPAGNEHGDIAARITYLLSAHVYKNDLGKVYAAETGFLISTSPDTVRAPDVSFVSHKRLASLEPTKGYLPVAPDLVVEVVSPNDRFSEVESKARQWLAAGTKVVLVADPENVSLRSYTNDGGILAFEAGDIFNAAEACVDWKLNVKEAFGTK